MSILITYALLIDMKELCQSPENAETISLVGEGISLKGTFSELIGEIEGCAKVDDVVKRSAYIEDLLGEVFLQFLNKAHNGHTVDFGLTILEESNGIVGETKAAFQLFKDGIQDDQNICVEELAPYLMLITKELSDKGYIENSWVEILDKTKKKHGKRKKLLDQSGNNLDLKVAILEGLNVIEEQMLSDESDKRITKFEQSEFYKKFSKVMESEVTGTDVVPSLQEIDNETTVLVFHKMMKKEIVGSLKRLGIDINFSRKGFTSLELKNGERIVLIPSKGIESMSAFSDVESTKNENIDESSIDMQNVRKLAKNVYYLGGKDMTRKFQAIHGKDSLSILADIDSEVFFGTKTELLPIADKDSVDRMIAGELPHEIATKFRAILTREAIKKLGESKVNLTGVDSNSEALVQLLKLKYPNKTITAVEIIQSGASVKDTHNYTMRVEEQDGKEVIVVYKPAIRKAGEDFSKDDIYKVIEKPSKELLGFVSAIQTEVNLELAKFSRDIKLSVEDILDVDSENKVQEFIVKLLEERSRELQTFRKINI